MSIKARIIAAVASAKCTLAAAAESAGSDPFAYSLKQYAAILGMTMLGGFVGWYAKVRRGELTGSSLFSLIGEMATSALSGLGAFFVCDHMQLPLGVTAAVAGLAGYMGGRAIEAAERWFTRYAAKRFGIDNDQSADGGKGGDHDQRQ